MRSTLFLLALTSAAPAVAPAQDAADMRGAVMQSEPYRSIRPGEMQSAAWLSEMAPTAFGRFLGPLSPATVQARLSAEMVSMGAAVAVLPPAGSAYQRGDTVILATVSQAPAGWGNKIQPTGLARITGVNPRQTEAVVIALYGVLREGQAVVPLPKLPKVGGPQPMKVDGPTGSYLFGRDDGDLQQQGSEVFIGMGQGSGLKLGDFVEIRRHAGPRVGRADTVDEPLAIGQVVNVGDKSSTVRLFRVMQPAIPAGSPVLRVATLGN